MARLPATNSWDVFIAYANPEREAAEDLYDLLAPEIRVFLDAKSIRPGDEWDRETAKAQRSSRITVVLVSNTTENAFYQREEIATAIYLARQPGENHRVVPIFLRGANEETASIPYGLRLRQGFYVSTRAHLENAAASLRELLKPPGSDRGEESSTTPNETVEGGGEFDPRTVDDVVVLSEGEYSTIATCVFQGRDAILKRTAERVADADTLRALVGKELKGWGRMGMSARVGTPLAVSHSDGFVWELHDRYRGVTLTEILLRSAYGFSGALLGSLFNAIFDALRALHELGIVHRDVTPSNILFDGESATIVDVSFACPEHGGGVTVGNPFFVAPEQRDNSPVRLSDWYSLAATIFFLSNRYAPHERGDEAFEEGLENIYVGNFSTSPLFPGDFRHLIKKLLEDDVSDRPPNARAIPLQPNSAALPGLPFHGILDLARYGHVVIANAEWFPLPSQFASFDNAFRLSRAADDFATPELRSALDELRSQYKRHTLR